MYTRKDVEETVENFIEVNTITDKEKIRIATGMPESVPESFLRTLVPVGISKFKGDNLPDNWSANEHFTKGKIYPIYESDNGEFPISDKTGKGMKMTPVAWTRIKFF